MKTKLSQAQINRLYKEFDKAFHHHGGVTLEQKTLSRLESAAKKLGWPPVQEVVIDKKTAPLVTVMFGFDKDRTEPWTTVLTVDQLRHNKWAIIRMVKAMFYFCQCTKGISGLGETA